MSNYTSKGLYIANVIITVWSDTFTDIPITTIGLAAIWGTLLAIGWHLIFEPKATEKGPDNEE